jgi:hypothetical protein
MPNEMSKPSGIEALKRYASEGYTSFFKAKVCPIRNLETNEFFCGTLVLAGGRVLIATAGHVIPHNPTGRLHLVTHDVRNVNEGSPGFLQWKRHPRYVEGHPESSIDVGYLEIDHDTTKEYFGHDDFCSPDHFADSRVNLGGQCVMVIGPPAALAGVKMVQGRQSLALEIMPYVTDVLRYEELPDDRVASGDHVLLAYPEESYDAVSMMKKPLPDAPGLSGAGVWCVPTCTTRSLWSPTQCRLAAIQGSWDKDRRYLRATRIHHWVDLVTKDYPDLSALFAGVHG